MDSVTVGSKPLPVSAGKGQLFYLTEFDFFFFLISAVGFFSISYLVCLELKSVAFSYKRASMF